MRAFVTGSRAYGTPRADSDIDIVLQDDGSLDVLRALADSCNLVEDRKDYPEGGTSLKFGRLNLIVPPSQSDFEAWRTATQRLTERRPVTRDQAIEEITNRLILSKQGVA